MLLLFVSRFVVSFSTVVNSVSSVLLYPVLLAQRTIVVPIKKYVARKEQRSALEQLLAERTEKYQKLLEENILLQATLSYHNQIKELTDFKKRYHNNDALLSQVLLRNIDDQHHFFLVDKGAKHGVVHDMVAVYKNCLIGKISEVYPFYSKLILVSDKSCKVAAHCAKTGASGIHAGGNNVACTALERVSHLSSVTNGDMVVSSGEGLVFPQGFALGTITSVRQDGLCFHIDVAPLVDLTVMQYCMLMKKGDCS